MVYGEKLLISKARRALKFSKGKLILIILIKHCAILT